MSKSIDSSALSKVIQDATHEVIEQIETFTKDYQLDPNVDTEVIDVMVNGKKITMKKEDYDQMKELNRATKEQMKQQIKEIIAESKNS